MELVLAQSAGSHTCSYTENQGHLAATARRPQHVAGKGYAGHVLLVQKSELLQYIVPKTDRVL